MQNRYAENLPEVLLWNQLKRDKLNADFHRQKPVAKFIIDLFCTELLLAIEIDGSYHNTPEMIVKDKKRQAELEALGIVFLRFTNDQIKDNIFTVVSIIADYIKKNKLPIRLNQLERALVNKNNLRLQILKIHDQSSNL